MDDMNWKSAMSSEIFREYVQNELAKEASQPSPQAELEDSFKLFQQVEAQIKQSPKAKQAYKVLQQKFATDDNYRMKTNKSFVDAVMMLNLD